MESLPSISIIIGVYNGAEMIGACLESLLNQNYPSHLYDIIVVENGSTDNTVDVVRRYPVRLFQSPTRGLASARNYGLMRSDAEIIASTDADCIAHPDWLRELARPYADAEVGGVGGYIAAYARDDRTTVELFLEEYAPLINFISGEHEFLPHLLGANASYRRHLLLRIGGYNERLVTAEDVDVSWRIQLETGARLVYAATAIIYHHHRTTEQGLKRLYQHYGFGEILLDTLYRECDGYPRDLNFQCRRIMGQIAALPRYMFSMLLRRWRLAYGRISPYEAEVPRLWLLIECSNIRGKLRALKATRLMRTAEPILASDRDRLIQLLYGTTHG